MKRKILSQAEWEEQVAASTSLQLRQLAASVLIRREGRVLDVGIDVSDEGEVPFVVVCGSRDGEVVARFALPAEDIAELARWTKWDRVAWDVRPSATEYGTVSFVSLVQSASDLSRRPTLDRAGKAPQAREGDAAAYMAWLKRYATYCRARKWAYAWKEHRAGTQRTWLLRGEIAQVDGGSAAAVVFGGFTRLLDVRNKRHTGREWGIASEPHWVEIHDPQLAESAHPGAFVEVEVRVREFASLGELSACDGRFDVTLALRRFVDAAPSVR